MIKIAVIPFTIITVVILIKYKPQYAVSINNKKIGYIDSQNEIDKYLEEDIKNIKGNISFVNFKNTPTFKLQLVNRNTDKQEETLKEEITNNLNIEYTNYAIAVDGKNKTYVSSEEEAQKIISAMKEKYDKTYTNKLSVIQVYADNNEEINALNEDDAKNIINDEIKKIKQTNSKTRLAKTSAKVTKVSSAKGIKFTVKPVTGIVTSRYGRRTSPGGIGSANHKGLDIAAKCGTTIKATAGGKVIYSGTKGELGKLIIIDHGNGVQTYYGHCNKLIASVGDIVSAGDKIAEVGKTGSATGYHLHLEVHINGVAVNPQSYIY